MVTDRHVFVVRHQRIVGPEQLARIGGVIDAGEEVGVVADRCRHFQAAVGGAVQQPGPGGFSAGAVRAIGIEQLADTAAQGHARFGTEREQRIERGTGRGLRGGGRCAGEQAEFDRGGEIENLVADRDAAARRAALRAEYAKRQVLDREVGMLVRRSDPAAPARRMGFVDHVVGSFDI